MKYSAILYKAFSFSLLSYVATATPLIEQGEHYGRESASAWGLSRRAPGVSAGVGIELEERNIIFKNDKQPDQVSDAVMAKAKGARWIFEKQDQAQKILDDEKGKWVFTAEHNADSNIQTLLPEIIVDGLVMKVGGTNPSLKDVGAKITEFMDTLKPVAEMTASIEGFDVATEGTWKIIKPTVPKTASNSDWGIQVTSPMQLANLQRRYMDSSTRDKKAECPIMCDIARKTDKLVGLKKTDIKLDRWDKIKANDIDDEFLGFFSLVVSYAKGVSGGYNTDLGPKQILPIMPRTDFQTMYNTFIKDKIDQQLKAGDCGLRDIVDDFAGETVSDNKIKWGSSGTVNTEGPADGPGGKSHAGVTWPSKVQDVASKSLEIGTWLDNLEDGKGDAFAAMDEIVFDGQIGALGSKMESIGNSPTGHPIFEFRDIGTIKGDKLGEQFDKIDKYLAGLSTIKKSKRVALPQQPAAGDTSKNDKGKCQCKGKGKKNKTAACPNDKCPTGQARQQGECKACPQGQKPNAAADKCIGENEKEDDCPTGQKKNPATDKCEDDPDACPAGQKKNTSTNKCEDDPDACPAGQKKNTSTNKCEDDPDACPKGEKKDPATKKCVKDDGAGDCPAGQKRNPTTEKCEDNGKEKRFQEKKKTETEAYKKRKAEKQAQTDKDKKELDDNRKKGEAKSNRQNMCLTMMIGAGFLAAEEIPSFETMGGFAGAFDFPADVKEPTNEISEANFKLEPLETSSKMRLVRRKKKGDSSCGFKCWLGREILNKISGGKLFPKNAAGKPIQINTSKLGKNTRDEDRKAAKDSPGLKKVNDDSNFKLCLAGTAAFTFATAYYTVGFDPAKIAAPSLDDVKPQPDDYQDQLKVCLWDQEDDTSEAGSYCWSSYSDQMYRQDRAPWQACSRVEDDINNLATAMKVENGCCAFYNGDKCDDFLFAATNRQDGELTDKGDNSISSFWCTGDLNCNGKP